MRSATFLFGVFLGAVGAMWASNRKSGWISAANQAGSLMKFTNLSKNKSNGTISIPTSGALKTEGSSATAVNPVQKAVSKESNMKMIKDFIKGNPDVRREVEQILKETHTVIPGL
ncbi:hypothetical protein [Paenibacillus caui]|uniref:hypothetical protein n=1 Tax=Paenibacillus caui TaxID=2873927 RepID=UPI001CA892AC|nr:hypothetical protein [Paenibacillus caui]